MSRVIYKIGSLLCLLVVKLNLIPLLFSKYRGESIILLLHGIMEKEDTSLNYRIVSSRNFEKLIKSLSHFCHFISVQDAVDGNVHSNKINIALTFDDGYKNLKQHALPVMEKYQVPGMIFITGINELDEDYLWGDFIDLLCRFSDESFEVEGISFQKKDRDYVSSEGQSLKTLMNYSDYEYKQKVYKACSNKFTSIANRSERLEYWQLLKDVEIKTLNDHPLISFGSHAYFHNNLDKVGASEVRKELIASNQYFERLLGKASNILAYPDGAYNEEVKNIAEELGYDYQLACDYQLETDEKDPRVFPRREINSGDNIYRYILYIFLNRYSLV